MVYYQFLNLRKKKTELLENRIDFQLNSILISEIQAELRDSSWTQPLNQLVKEE